LGLVALCGVLEPHGINVEAHREQPAAVIRVLVVDDHDLIRFALSSALDAVEEFEVIGTCADGAEAVEAAARVRPDVIVMDLFMPGMGGLDATRQILAGDPQTRVVVLSAGGGTRDVSDALAAGASEFLSKDAGLDALICAVRGPGTV